MNKITSQEALNSAYNAAKGQLALRCTAAHDIKSAKKNFSAAAVPAATPPNPRS